MNEAVKLLLDALEKQRNTIEYECFGSYALFTDPIYKLGGEKCTLQIPPYEAIKGITHSIYWKPTFIWVIDAVRVMNPIQTEVKGIRPIKMNGGNDLSYYMYLKDVRYQVRAHFEWNTNRPELEKDRNEYKHHNIAKRMLERGGRRDIFLGTRECQGYVVPCVFGEGEGAYDDIPRIDFGNTYHGITYADESYSPETENRMTVRYWSAFMRHGIIEYPKPWECELARTAREMKIKPFGKEYDNFIGLDEFTKEDFDGTS